MNLFKFICYILSFTAFIKVFFGVFFHEKFYVWARHQYAKPYRSWTVNALLFYAFLLLALSWVGLFFYYVKYGWLLTAILTLASVKSMGIFLNWEKTSGKFVRFIDQLGKKKLWLVDLVVLIIGLFFLWLGLFIY